MDNLNLNKNQISSTTPKGQFIEIDLLMEKVLNEKIPELLREKAIKLVERLYRMVKFSGYSSEFELIEKYIDWIVRIPWGKYSKDNLNLQNAKQILDKNHYGLESVKERILQFLAVKSLRLQSKTENGSSTVLCFVGIQGIGKTSMVKSIAEALGRKFVRISLGALGSGMDLKGISKAVPNSEPGQIIKAMIRTESMNPVILLDEIDKVSEIGGRRADINAALLEILDPEQNSMFVDSYIDFPVDLSQILFVCTANNLAPLSQALLDRLEVIRFSSYSDDEKIHIAKYYLFPKLLKNTGLTNEIVQIDDEVWPQIIRPLGFDAGVRQLERNISEILRKIAVEIVSGKSGKFHITLENFRSYLPEDIGVYS